MDLTKGMNMTEERKKQREFEQAMREQGWSNSRFKRPVNPLLYLDTDTAFAWKIWQLARRNTK